jgi:hypothetical protein
MTAEKIEELRALTLNHDVFADMQTFFLDHFVDARGFIEKSKPYKHFNAKSLVNSILEELPFKGRIQRVIQMMVVKYEQTPLIHGSGPLQGGGFVAFYYFEDENFGLLSVIRPQCDTVFSRIKLSTPDKGSPFSNIDAINLN